MEFSGLTIIMMAGLPGAGKTTLAYALERELGWRLIDKDRYRIDLLEQGVEFEIASGMAYDRSFDEIRKALMEHQSSVIFDTAALHRSILDSVNEILQGVGDVRLKVILCAVERDLRSDRLSAREFQYTRLTVEPDTLIDYLGLFDHLPEDRLVVYTDLELEECLEQIKVYLFT